MGSHIPTCPSLHSHEATATQQHNSEDTAVIALGMHLTVPTVHPSRRSRRSVRLRRRPSRMPRPSARSSWRPRRSSTRSTARHKRRQLMMPSRRRRSSTKRNGNCSNHLPTQACTAVHTLMAHTATVQEVSQAHTDTEHHTELDTEHHTELEHEDTDMDMEQEPLVAITKCDENIKKK